MSDGEPAPVEVEDVLAALEAAIGQDTAAKTDALRALTALIDPADEGYSVQRAAAEALLPSVLMQLLDDDEDGVKVEAANALAAMVDHSGTVTDKIGAGHFGATLDKAPLNPVQEQAGELDGVFNTLVNMKFSDSEALATAGTEALSALTNLNRSNTIALMHEVVKRLVAGEARALAALDDIVVSIDMRDDAAVLLDQALTPALGFLRSGKAADKTAAASLLGSIADGRRGAAPFLVAEGALPDAAALLIEGAELEARDAAAHLTWVLVKDQKSLLAPGRDKGLGVEGIKLLDPLLELIELSEAAEGGEEDGAAAPEVAVDNGDSALLLMRALAAQDDAVNTQLKGEGGLIATRSCTIM